MVVAVASPRNQRPHRALGRAPRDFVGCRRFKVDGPIPSRSAAFLIPSVWMDSEQKHAGELKLSRGDAFTFAA